MSTETQFAELEQLMEQLEQKTQEIELLKRPAKIPITIHVDGLLIKSAPRKHILAGYASIPVIDREGDRIPKAALQDALTRFLKHPEYCNFMLHHTNIQLGKIIPEYRTPDGKIWRTQVDDKGLFIVAELRDDIKAAREAIKRMQRGQLLSLSIAGEALAAPIVCNGECHREIQKFDLYEVSACEEGVNPQAKAFLLKALNIVGENLKNPQSPTDDGRLKMAEEINQPGVSDIAAEEEEKEAEPATEEVEETKEEPETEEAKEEEKQKPTAADVAAILQEIRNGIKAILAALKYPKYPKYPKYYYYYKKPTKKDFESEEEYEEAVKAYEGFKAEITKEIRKELESGAIEIKKSVKTPEKPETEEVDFNELWKKAEEAVNIRDYLGSV